MVVLFAASLAVQSQAHPGWVSLSSWSLMEAERRTSSGWWGFWRWAGCWRLWVLSGLALTHAMISFRSQENGWRRKLHWLEKLERVGAQDKSIDGPAQLFFSAESLLWLPQQNSKRLGWLCTQCCWQPNIAPTPMLLIYMMGSPARWLSM